MNRKKLQKDRVKPIVFSFPSNIPYRLYSNNFMNFILRMHQLKYGYMKIQR